MTYYAIILTVKVIIMAKYVRTLGDIGSNLLTELSRQGKRLFTLEDAAKIYGKSNGGLHKLLFTLVKRRWLQRIERGKYLILPFEAGREGEWTEHEFIIASYLIEPYYIGFRSALNYYGYTEQVSRTVFVVSTRRKSKPALEISGVTYRFVHISERNFFGFTEKTLDGSRVNISNPEKTIVDCLGRLRYCGGIVEVAKALWYGRDELDFAKIAEYARKAGNKAVNQRLGYLLETLGVGTGETINLLLAGLSKRYAPLDTLGNTKGRYVDRWKVMVNVPENELLQWKES
ncbi:MAG: hypothetical protein IMY81_01795 [Chloroflexi bacterium]|nr:hypothetical protein [Chloroflexota bacterium]